MTTRYDHPEERSDRAEDPSLAHLVADLRTAYSTAAPTPVRAAVAEVLERQAEGQRAAHRRDTIRHGWSRRMLPAAVLAVAVLVVGSAVASAPLVDQVFGPFAGGKDGSSAAPPGQQVALSQTACGYTLSVDRVYADANRVVIGYTITEPADRAVASFSATPLLTDAQGRSLHPIMGGGTGISEGTNGNAAAFDLEGRPVASPLALRLTVPIITAMEAATGTVAAPDRPCESPGPPVQDLQPGGPAFRQTLVTTDFAFDLTVPVTTSVRTVEVNTTGTSAHGTTVTLERVVVTPSETRLYLRGPMEDDVAGGPAIAPTLTIDGREVDAVGGSTAWPVGNGEMAVSIAANLYDNHGSWAVKVLTDPAMTNGSRSYTDAVTFPITVP